MDSGQYNWVSFKNCVHYILNQSIFVNYSCFTEYTGIYSTLKDFILHNELHYATEPVSTNVVFVLHPSQCQCQCDTFGKHPVVSDLISASAAEL